ncbi:SLC13 family permease [Temperatibacter marinus]|uniref:SLC13 family permease n=1 Tax=Temperatibacter marinus TaxID=1456591 RepID=A0AA52HBL1_9PROT|nr:SLC13 family permease [Temperatibacter marinus]WND03860.1 SLC13 family permease [Temperatibacter marinus]
MTTDQIIFFLILGCVFLLFVWGRWRYDFIAFGALLASVFAGLVSSEIAFSGFSHPAVITVASVLIISRGIAVSGAIDRIAHIVVPPVKSLALQIGCMSGFAALLSAIMNNVAALALLMPATIESAKNAKRSPALLLMPLSFGSILGGLITLIGTPPNIVIGSYRQDALGEPFSMFDFAPVGGVIALVGVIYLALIGWRLLPKERQSNAVTDELFDIDNYTSEVVVKGDSAVIGMKLSEFSRLAKEQDVIVVDFVRNHQPLGLRKSATLIKEKDCLIVVATPKDLDGFTNKNSLELKGQDEEGKGIFSVSDAMMMEAVISSDSRLIGRESGDIRLKSRYGLNLLGVSRQGKTIRKRLHKVIFQAGDILLLQGDDCMPDALAKFKLLPLESRDIQIGKRSHAWLAIGLLAFALILTATGTFGLTICLAIAAFGMVATSIVPLRDVYDSIDWPVLVLVGAMIPIGGALETTGSTTLITDFILSVSEGYSPVIVLLLLFIITMTLSDIMNNVATAVMMAPIGVALATALDVNPDTFLMAVAVSSSCAFLTPIGHKNNALVMGPGGYEFGDYWRVGLPLEVIITCVAIPMILLVWPLT